jgi:hypothetical protein
MPKERMPTVQFDQLNGIESFIKSKKLRASRFEIDLQNQVVHTRTVDIK